jgi:GTP-binding protein HflX
MKQERERAILVGLAVQRHSGGGRAGRTLLDDHLDELEQLVDTAGGDVVVRMAQGRQAIDPAYFIGRGKAEELAWLARERDIQLIVFDDDLSPVQARNLERLTERKIVDRSGIILDIFASRARTSEARVQVELAQLQYMLPRLTRQWTHLSKQYGGIGTKGPGETQIETDRRVIRTRIGHLRERLKGISKERAEQRKGRDQFLRVALVGYTNVGKSTLMNRLSGSDLLVENRLFATLDSTTRLVSLSGADRVLITDTVGFIRKLPHHLVASFKSTLEEVAEADVLLHIADAGHPEVEEQISVVNETLGEIGVASKPTILVFNKTDRVRNRERLRGLAQLHPGALFVSASRSIGIGSLLEKLKSFLAQQTTEETLRLTAADHRIISQIHDSAEVLETSYDGDTVTIRFRMNKRKAGRLLKHLGGAGNHTGKPA